MSELPQSNWKVRIPNIERPTSNAEVGESKRLQRGHRNLTREPPPQPSPGVPGEGARRRLLALFFALLLSTVGLSPTFAQPATQPTTNPRTIRCAVIGGMQETGFWPALAERFEKQSGIHVEITSTGPKETLDQAVREGGIDLVTMHASDTILNLVADGFAADPQPWLRNDMVLVGPADDPAGIKGEPDAAKALKKIAAAKAPFVVHSSLGAQEVLRAVLDAGNVEMSPEQVTILFEDRQRRVLGIAAEKKAYTLIGRIPFRSGKIPNANLVVMVQGDPKLRRPYVVAVANPAKVAGARSGLARQLAAYLRSDETQAWIAGFGKGQLDDQPIFFPVGDARPATRPAGEKLALLTVSGETPKSLVLSKEQFAALPRKEVRMKDRDGKEIVYSGVAVETILEQAGLSVPGNHLRNGEAGIAVVVQAADGYQATFGLVEVLEKFSGHPVLIADRKDGKALEEKDGPLKLIVEGDARPVRAVRQVMKILVVTP